MAFGPQGYSPASGLAQYGNLSGGLADAIVAAPKAPSNVRSLSTDCHQRLAHLEMCLRNISQRLIGAKPQETVGANSANEREPSALEVIQWMQNTISRMENYTNEIEQAIG